MPAATVVAALLLAPAGAFADNVKATLTLSPASGPANTLISATTSYQPQNGNQGKACGNTKVAYAWDGQSVGVATFVSFPGTVPLCVAMLSFEPPAELAAVGTHQVSGKISGTGGGSSVSATFRVTSSAPPPPPPPPVTQPPTSAPPIPSPAATDPAGSTPSADASVPADAANAPESASAAPVAVGAAGPGSGTDDADAGSTGGTGAGTVAIVFGAGLTLCGALVGLLAFNRARRQAADDAADDLDDDLGADLV